MVGLTVPQDAAEIVARLSVSAIAGAVIGLERYVHGRSAGLRTHVLVCAGSAMFTIFSLLAPLYDSAGVPNSDPGRIAAQIVTGIGFLGAGVIIKQGATVRGLTTAACLWVAASIGMAAGGGLYLVSAFVTALTVLTLIGLNWFERRFEHAIYRRVVVVTDLEAGVREIIDAVNSAGAKVFACDSERDFSQGKMTVYMDVRLTRRDGSTQSIADNSLSALKAAKVNVFSFSWTR
ncbi:MgtC/SapB family protein [bacterium]|nr:MAG: MgtC/SapB family protein [bacterium]